LSAVNYAPFSESIPVELVLAYASPVSVRRNPIAENIAGWVAEQCVLVPKISESASASCTILRSLATNDARAVDEAL